MSVTFTNRYPAFRVRSSWYSIQDENGALVTRSTSSWISMSCIENLGTTLFPSPLLVPPFHPFTAARGVHVTRALVCTGGGSVVAALCEGKEEEKKLKIIAFFFFLFPFIYLKLPPQKQGGWQQLPKKSTCAHLDRIPSSQSRAVS